MHTHSEVRIEADGVAVVSCANDTATKMKSEVMRPSIVSRCHGQETVPRR